MANFLYANFAHSELQAELLAGATTLQIDTVDAGKFPTPGAGEAFRLVLYTDTQQEIVECTNRAGNILTITRGMEGTADQRFPAGTKAVVTITAGMIGQIKVTNGSIT